jgi:hypothetical protein
MVAMSLTYAGDASVLVESYAGCAATVIHNRSTSSDGNAGGTVSRASTAIDQMS